MSTIGHPLSDLTNLLTKFITAATTSLTAATATSSQADGRFLPGRTPGLPTSAQIVSWYADASGYDPREGRELAWGAAFNLFRLASICQGIAARYATRQASSERAREHARERGPLAEVAWELVKQAQEEGGDGKGGEEKARL